MGALRTDFLTTGGKYRIIKLQKYPNEEVPEMILFAKDKIPGRAARDLLI